MMKKSVLMFLGLFFVMTSIGLFSAAAAEQDAKGSKDHRLLSRMPNFHIYQYRDKDFDVHKFMDKDGKRIPAEGRFYYIKYVLNKGAAQPGELKVIRNIQNALAKVGGKVLNENRHSSTIMIQKDGKETWVEVKPWGTGYELFIVEKEEMKQEVVADASAMGNNINTTGHVSVYGIYFDTGKSEVKPESDAALSEIAKLLKNDGALNVYVVGHTDNVGTFESNMKLSIDRADAVAKALSGKYAIAAARLKPQGVASLSPVTSNDTEEGKAKNRRVELVKQ
jgi:outer membrane protein OmpA-like peptidoglycan-associated protein